jgi:UDPglucose--hexose-1-phosphate uridylyltransferase
MSGLVTSLESAPQPMSELRCDPLLNRWVLIAPARESRPNDFAAGSRVEQSAPLCPFCEGNEHLTGPEQLARRAEQTSPNGPGWTIRVIPNRYPAVTSEDEFSLVGESSANTTTGWGRHEVIVETPRHLPLSTTHSADHWNEILQVFQERLRDFRRIPGLQHAFVFKNHGPAAGASFIHPHCQIIALPRVPNAVADEIQAGDHWWRQTGHCPRCELVAGEIQDASRLVTASSKIVAFCPHASRFPYETWLLPRRHSSDFASAPPEVLNDLSSRLPAILVRLEQVIPGVSYNLVLHTAPLHAPALPGFHWRLEILPRLTGMAGFEWGSGWFINQVAPERAAQVLRPRD